MPIPYSPFVEKFFRALFFSVPSFAQSLAHLRAHNLDLTLLRSMHLFTKSYFLRTLVRLLWRDKLLESNKNRNFIGSNVSMRQIWWHTI